MARPRVGMFAVLGAPAAASAGCSRRAPASAPREAGPSELEARIEAPGGLIPEQAHIMADVVDHFAGLWSADEP
jgi:hypothetical protein